MRVQQIPQQGGAGPVAADNKEPFSHDIRIVLPTLSVGIKPINVAKMWNHCLPNTLYFGTSPSKRGSVVLRGQINFPCTPPPDGCGHYARSADDIFISQNGNLIS